MKAQNTNKLEFKKIGLISLNTDQLLQVNGGGDTKPCFLCIRTSNGPGSIVLEQLNQA